jgi:hypothetical protein
MRRRDSTVPAGDIMNPPLLVVKQAMRTRKQQSLLYDQSAGELRSFHSSMVSGHGFCISKHKRHNRTSINIIIIMSGWLVGLLLVGWLVVGLKMK